jgi:hypothetical protein
MEERTMNRRWWLTHAHALALALGTITAMVALTVLDTRAAHAEWRRDNREACAKLDDRLKDIENRRRAGYTAKQGRTLATKREAIEQQRREKCR